MGFAKRQFEEEEERGWRSGGAKTVCDRHLEDEALVRLVGDAADATCCSYCDREADTPFAIDIDVLIERIATSIPFEWRGADDEGVAWDEGDYVGETYDSWDLITDLGPLNHGDLIADVVRALPEHAWVQRDFYRLRPDERLVFGWRQFGEIVKHRRRYFFADDRPDALDDDPDYVAPGEMLVAIGDALQEAGLVRTLSRETPVHRVRAHERNQYPTDAASLGVAPQEFLRASGRMAPAGVPLFYGALDFETADDEARHANPSSPAFTHGTFALRRPAVVVDLASPPSVPSLFDPVEREHRPAFNFLRQFSESVSQPFERDDRVHIEYVPTQVVTEWLRTRFDPGDSRRLDGVLFASARRPGGQNLALFIDNHGACDREDEAAEDPALLVLNEHRELPPAPARAVADPFSKGELPSAFAEAQNLPAVQRLLAEQVDMQFADLRALLRLPNDDIAPNVGVNLTATAAILGQISGLSIWFLQNRWAQTISREEKQRRMILSKRRFLGFVRAYYPRAAGEPDIRTIARTLYETRNLLVHNLGVTDAEAKKNRRQVFLVKPDPPLTSADVVDLETHAQYPLAGTPVRLDGRKLMLNVPGLYWALGRMLRSALADEPARCETRAEALLDALPVPRGVR
jgi:hypothetical protein